MDNNILEMRMRLHEMSSYLVIEPSQWLIIRVDGRGFSKMTQNLLKPFDQAFHDVMMVCMHRLMTDFGGVYGHTHSDEISILVPLGFDMFNRRIEKLVSVSASTASSRFQMEAVERRLPIEGHTLVTFDSRIWNSTSIDDVWDYFVWRQEDSYRNCVHSYAYWQARGVMDATKATRLLKGMNSEAQLGYLRTMDVDLKNVPTWQRRGTGCYTEDYTKVGWNPMLQKSELADRRRLVIDEELPDLGWYKDWLQRSIGLRLGLDEKTDD